MNVYAVSRDSPWTHIAWSQTLDLNIPLLSDWNAEAVQAFEIGRTFRGHEGVPERSAFTFFHPFRVLTHFVR